MEIQFILELLGTFVFAISGALAVDEKDQDWFGAGFMGFITAIGGGTLRDVLLGSYPLVWIGDVRFLYAIFAAIVFAAVFYKVLLRLRRTLQLFDSMGIALFTVVGTEKALSLGVHPVIAAIMGMFTAVMGGVIRDTLANETPVIFQKEIYASACLAGAFAYIGFASFEVQRTVSFLAAVVLIIAIRLVAIKYNLSLPRYNRFG